MTPTPEVSYIVLSYNYENYIGQTIRSILEQTHQDFEIVVVDDASSDRSCEIVEAFGDARIRVIRNATNIGGAASYNKAVEAARGTWLSNLDADDWIAPTKTRTQLDAVRGRPEVAVIGSFVHFMGADGTALANAELHDAEVNVPRDLNLIDQWIGRNSLCRSSTLVRRALHLEIGLDDPTMSRAPDYELWTRFRRAGHHILVHPERLTFYRLHARGVTYGDPIGTFMEMCWILLRNLKPTAEKIAAWPAFEAMLRWVGTHPRLSDIGARERERILGLFMVDELPPDYAGYRELIGRSDPQLEVLGRRTLGMILGRVHEGHIVALRREVELGMRAAGDNHRLERDIELYIEARDYWRARYETTYLQRLSRSGVIREAADRFRPARALIRRSLKSLGLGGGQS